LKFHDWLFIDALMGMKKELVDGCCTLCFDHILALLNKLCNSVDRAGGAGDVLVAIPTETNEQTGTSGEADGNGNADNSAIVNSAADSELATVRGRPCGGVAVELGVADLRPGAVEIVRVIDGGRAQRVAVELELGGELGTTQILGHNGDEVGRDVGQRRRCGRWRLGDGDRCQAAELVTAEGDGDGTR